MQKTDLFDFKSKPKILEWVDNVKPEIEKEWEQHIEQGKKLMITIEQF